MLTYTLERGGGLPLYELLYRSIREDILSGNLKNGEKLPSKRRLAEHLGVSIMTVETAFAQLSLEGYIRSEQRRGYFVCADFSFPAPRAAVKTLAAEVSQKEWLADFKTNAILPRQFPFSVWAKLMRRVLAERSPALLAPMPGQGLPELREAIAGFLSRFRGMQVSAEQIVVAAGAELLYGLLVQLLGRDKLIAVEDPGYPRAAKVYRNNGAETVPIPLDAGGLSVRELAAAEAQVAHISPAHHFPTGLVMPAARRAELLNWAGADENRFLIEDDYDSEFRFSGRPIPTLQSADRLGRVIYLNTFTKTLSPALRIGYLVLPETLLDAFSRRLGFYSCTVPSFEQLTLAKFINEGYFESHLARTRNFYRRQRDKMIESIRESALGAHCRILEADAGLHFVLETDASNPDLELTAQAQTLGINISCLSEYYTDRLKARPGCLLLNYSHYKQRAGREEE